MTTPTEPTPVVMRIEEIAERASNLLSTLPMTAREVWSASEDAWPKQQTEDVLSCAVDLGLAIVIDGHAHKFSRPPGFPVESSHIVDVPPHCAGPICQCEKGREYLKQHSSCEGLHRVRAYIRAVGTG